MLTINRLLLAATLMFGVVMSIETTAAQQDKLQQAIEACRSPWNDNGINGTEVAARTTDTAVILIHPSWTSEQVITGTQVIFVDPDVAVIIDANPNMTVTIERLDQPDTPTASESAGTADFKDMRLTIKKVRNLLVHVDGDEIILTNPFWVGGEPYCFVTRHTAK